MRRGIDYAKEAQRRRMQAHGTEPSGGTANTVTRDLFRQEGDRSARLRHYLATSPSGERDVSKRLDALEDERGTWLREALDAADD